MLPLFLSKSVKCPNIPVFFPCVNIIEEDSMIQQSTYFGPNFRKWYEFGLFPENQSEFGLNFLRMSDCFNFRCPTGPRKGSTDGFLGAPVNFCKASFFIQSLLA